MSFPWPFRPKNAASSFRFQFYTRTGCHLCEDAWDLLTDYQRRYGFQMTLIDVDSDPALIAQYGEQVPVVVVDGRVRFRGKVNAVLLRRLLENAAGSGES